MTSIKEYRAQYWESDGLYNSVIEKSGLSTSELMTLYCVSNGINTQTAISKKLCMPKQTINSAVKKFEKQGIMVLVGTLGNNKLKTLALTAKGEELVKDKVLAMDNIEEAVWAELEEDEKEQLVRLTARFNKLLAEKVAAFLKED